MCKVGPPPARVDARRRPYALANTTVSVVDSTVIVVNDTRSLANSTCNVANSRVNIADKTVNMTDSARVPAGQTGSGVFIAPGRDAGWRGAEVGAGF